MLAPKTAAKGLLQVLVVLTSECAACRRPVAVGAPAAAAQIAELRRLDAVEQRVGAIAARAAEHAEHGGGRGSAAAVPTQPKHVAGSHPEHQLWCDRSAMSALFPP